MNVDEKKPAMQPEQAADLAALKSGATAQPGPVQEEEVIQPPSQAALQMAAMAVGLAKPLVCFAVPSLQGAPDELWAPVPEGVAAVLDLYGANADWMKNPWARLGLSLMPLVAYAAVQAMNKPPEEPKQIKAKEEEQTPGVPSKGVVFGDPVVVQDAD